MVGKYEVKIEDTVGGLSSVVYGMGKMLEMDKKAIAPTFLVRQRSASKFKFLFFVFSLLEYFCNFSSVP